MDVRAARPRWSPARIALAHRIVAYQTQLAIAALSADLESRSTGAALRKLKEQQTEEPPWWDQAVHAEQGFVWMARYGWVPAAASQSLGGSGSER